MTTQQFGTLEPFDGADSTDYSERLNAYFIAHNIGQVAADAREAANREADKEKVAVTNSVIGKPLTVRSKISVFLIYPPIKLTISLHKFWDY